MLAFIDGRLSLIDCFCRRDREQNKITISYISTQEVHTQLPPHIVVFNSGIKKLKATLSFLPLALTLTVSIAHFTTVELRSVLSGKATAKEIGPFQFLI